SFTASGSGAGTAAVRQACRDARRLIHLADYGSLGPLTFQGYVDDLLRTWRKKLPDRGAPEIPAGESPKEAQPAGDAIQRALDRLDAEEAAAQRSVPQEDEAQDGPKPPNVLVWKGARHELPPTPWRLLNALWHHESRPCEEVATEVWGDDAMPDSTIKP